MCCSWLATQITTKGFARQSSLHSCHNQEIDDHCKPEQGSMNTPLKGMEASHLTGGTGTCAAAGRQHAGEGSSRGLLTSMQTSLRTKSGQFRQYWRWSQGMQNAGVMLHLKTARLSHLTAGTGTCAAAGPAPVAGCLDIAVWTQGNLIRSWDRALQGYCWVSILEQR